MTPQQWQTIVVAIVGALSSQHVIRWVSQRRKTSAETDNQIVDTATGLLSHLRDEVDRLSDRLRICEERGVAQEGRINALEDENRAQKAVIEVLERQIRELQEENARLRAG